MYRMFLKGYVDVHKKTGVAGFFEFGIIYFLFFIWLRSQAV